MDDTKFPLTSMDLTYEQLRKMKELFPEVFTEGNKIDWERLKLTLGENVDVGKERYGMNWPGKADCFKTIQQKSIATLVPVREESVDFDTTKNVFIEGDNLEVLKLLQKSYLGKVKMIYIDPPYNTGNDFIYPDNYSENLGTYLQYTGQVDAEGRKFTTNTETEGRYHSKWINMMYPRLFLAKNLLKEDGVIFISIDEIEYPKLRSICDEIFGEENHIADFVWQNKKGGGNDSKYVAVEHEYIVMYAKNEIRLHKLFEPYKPEYLKRYREEDEEGKFFWDTFRRKSGKQFYAIKCPDGSTLETDKNGNPISWLRSEKTFQSDLLKGEIKFVKLGGQWSVYFKQRLPLGKKPRSIFLEESLLKNKGTTSEGSAEVLELFGKEVFPNPKPTTLIKHLLGFNVSSGDIILDFFAGSGTTGHAVMDFADKENFDIKFILVQLPEVIDGKSEQSKNAISLGYKKICDVTKERLRKAALSIKTNSKLPKDLDFKIFKLQRSNFNIWDSISDTNSEVIQQKLLDHIKHISFESGQEAILYELLLKSGFELTTQVSKIELEKKTVFSIADGELLICLERELSHELMKKMADMKPSRVICLDEGFQNNDQLKTNTVQLMKSKGVEKFQTV